MKTDDIISSFYFSFYSLIQVVKDDIKWDKLTQDKLKGVLEGRYQAFQVASSQLNTIKDLQESQNIFKEKEFKSNVKELIDSTDKILTQITDVLEMSITTGEEADDEKTKVIVQSKKIAGDFLLEINNTKNDMQFKLDNLNSSVKDKKNFATMKVKG